MRFALFVLLLGFAACAAAHEFTGRVVGVSDGDTLTVLDSRRVKRKIRLAAIDAPEKPQAHGQQSRIGLMRLAQGRVVKVVWHTRDLHGRVVGKVLLRPTACDVCDFSQDAGLLQIEAGNAWWYREFRNEQHITDQRLYESAEASARQAWRGLWADSRAIAPWEWRKQHNPVSSTQPHVRKTSKAGKPA